MENSYEIELQNSIDQLDALSAQCRNEINSWESSDYSIIEECESSLDAWDYCLSIAIGMAGARIATVEELGVYLNDIHHAASGASGDYDRLQEFLGVLLHHKGDAIDKLPEEKFFINRKHDTSYVLFHRLLWGHDVLSFGEDNPFKLMFDQKGILGLLQALRHLIADTTSKQGLPIPGSSYLDYLKDDGKISNYLIKIAQELSKDSVGNLRSAQTIYSHMFTLRAQDIIGGGAITGFNELYFKIRGIDDDVRRVQFRIIAYTTAFFGEAIIGSTRQAGIPYVNIPLAAIALKSLAQLYYFSNKDTLLLHKKTAEILSQDDLIEDRVHRTSEELSALLNMDN